MPGDPNQSAALRAALRDLVALSTIPAAWVGRQPAEISAGLADVLVGSLGLDFASVRLRDPKSGAAVEATRGDSWRAFPEWLESRGGRVSRSEVISDVGDPDTVPGIVIPIGVNGEGGLVAAACAQSDFPSEIDQLLLSVAANHAATAFQSAQLIDARRRTEEALRQSEQELRQARDELEMKVMERTAELRQSRAYLAEAQLLSHTGSFGWNPRSGQIIWSEETFRILGYDPSLQPTVALVLARTHPDDRARLEEAIERAARDEKDELDIEHRLLMPDGSIKYVHVVGHQVKEDESGNVEFVGTVMDVTEHLLASEALQKAQSDLAHMSRVTTMGELTASLAHEVNQPITAAVTNANTCLRWLARENPDLKEARQAVSRMVKDVTRAAEIVSRVRSLFRKSTPQRERVEVNEIIREMILLLRGEAGRYSISLRADLAPELPPVMADRVQLQQVLMNLMLNAIEAMGEANGRRELTIKSERDEAAQLVISVSDTGVGLPSEQADQIFNAFFTTKPQGTGMGLSISRSIVESHGGRLWAAANAGPGTTFSFSLPTQAESGSITASADPASSHC